MGLTRDVDCSHQHLQEKNGQHIQFNLKFFFKRESCLSTNVICVKEHLDDEDVSLTTGYIHI